MTDLVVWPDRNQELTSRDLEAGEFFTIENETTMVWMTTEDGYVCVFSSGRGYGGTHYKHSKCRVYRLDMTTPPQFTVCQ